MMSQARIIALASALSFALTSWPASAGDNDNGFVRLTPDDLVWQVLEPGLSVAIVEGDPGKEGFYIIRARFAPGVFSAPHYHPNDRFITVIQGTWWTGRADACAWVSSSSAPTSSAGSSSTRSSSSRRAMAGGSVCSSWRVGSSPKRR
jgi:hypothetical protein